MKKEITKAAAIDLFMVLRSVSQMPKIPLKFCIARNMKVLSPIAAAYEEKREELFKTSVVLDENGEPVVREEFKKMFDENQGQIPYSGFEFESDEKMNDFLAQIDKEGNEVIEVEFSEERVDRKIKISNAEGKYEDSTIMEVLEDPECGISTQMILLFGEYFLILD